MLGYTVPPTETAAEDVACPGGQRALGGGVSFGGWGAAIHNGAAEERTASVWPVCDAR